MINPLTLIHGDCVEVMRGMDECSVDAIVTDPPYGLEFMGKDWDRFEGARFSSPGIGERQTPWPSYSGWNDARCDNCGHLSHGGSPCKCDKPAFRSLRGGRMVAFQEFSLAWAVEALRVLRPGGHLLSFGGTRTFHRMTVAIEDAGFEIRDCLMWLYGSGFPKSYDVSKAIDKAAGAEREVVEQRSFGARDGSTPTAGASNGGVQGGYNLKDDRSLTAPSTDLAKKWQGWGTALKPAWEPIILARKPLVGTVAANVERFGTGALNIDGTRVGMSEADRRDTEARINTPNSHRRIGAEVIFGPDKPRADFATNPGGRWPANVLLDEESAAILDAASGERASGKMRPTHTDARRAVFGQNAAGGYTTMETYGDTGGASRFFYVAKADKADRSGSTHPTVKPVDLMRYLCRLVTPPGGLVLDPFAGSGTTGQAALAEGFRCVLIEKDAQYVEGIKTWRANMQLGLGLVV